MIERQGPGRRKNALLVDRDTRQRRAFRAGGDDDRPGFDLVLGAISAGDGNFPRRGDTPEALEPVDLVLAEQELDAAGQGGYHPVLARHHRAEVEPDVADLDPVLGERVPGFGEFLRGLQQCLRRDAADVEAGAAEAVAALDAGRLEPELRRPDRRDIAARPGPDDDDVVAIGHDRWTGRPPSMRDQNRHRRRRLQHVLSKAAEHPLAQPTVAVPSHHQQGLVLGRGGEHGIGRAAPIGL